MAENISNSCWFSISTIPDAPFKPEVVDLVWAVKKWWIDNLEIPSTEKIKEVISKNPIFRIYFEVSDNWVIKVKYLKDILNINSNYNEKILMMTLNNTLLNLFKEIYWFKWHLTRNYTKNVEVEFWDELSIWKDWLYKDWIKIYDFTIKIEDMPINL